VDAALGRRQRTEHQDSRFLKRQLSLLVSTMSQ
jgi:hypothetical protein